MWNAAWIGKDRKCESSKTVDNVKGAEGGSVGSPLDWREPFLQKWQSLAQITPLPFWGT